MMTDLALYFSLAAGFTVLSFLAGHLLMSLGDGEWTENPYACFFKRISLGALAVVTLWAVANCGGVTIMAGILPLLAFGMRLKAPRWRKIAVDSRAVALFCAVFVLLVAFQFFKGADLAGNFYPMHRDYSFYAALANYVARSGIESANVELLYPALQSPTIYHWFDIHLLALAGKLSPNYAGAQFFVVIPFLGALSVLGIAAVIARYRPGRAVAWLSCIVMLVPLLSFNLFGGRFSLLTVDYYDIVSYKAYAVVAIVAWIILSGKKVLAAMIGGLAVSTAAPALFAGAAMALAFGFASGYRRRDYWMQAAALAFGVLWAVAFYTFAAVENPLFTSHLSEFAQIKRAFMPGSRMEVLQYAQLFVFNFAFEVIPLLLLLFFMSGDDRRMLAGMVRQNGLLLFSIVAGLIFACLFWFMRDAVQLATEMSLPLCFVFQTLVLALLLTSRRPAGRIAAAVTVVTGVALSLQMAGPFRGKALDKGFYDKVAAAEGPVGWVEIPHWTASGDGYARDVNYMVPFPNVRRLRDDYFPIRLDVYDIVYNNADIREYGVLASIENSSFYRWVESEKISMKELWQAQNRFIREHGIKYLILPAGGHWLDGRGFVIEERTDSPTKNYTLFKIGYNDHSVQ